MNSSPFKLVRHSALNTITRISLDAALKESDDLFEGISDRQFVTFLEGDLVDVEGEPWLNHSPFIGKRTRRYVESKYHEGMAVPLDEALGLVRQYKEQHPGSSLGICMELKAWPSASFTQRAIDQIRDYGFSGDELYFDSFFPHRLMQVRRMAGGEFQCSYHAGLNIGPLKIGLPFSFRQDIVTVPHKTSFGNPGCPIIYGAVGSREVFEEIVQDPDVVGAYPRFREGSAARMFLSSIRDKAVDRLRMYREMLQEPGFSPVQYRDVA